MLFVWSTKPLELSQRTRVNMLALVLGVIVAMVVLLRVLHSLLVLLDLLWTQLQTYSVSQTTTITE